jgi:cytochrome oxidase assembly protein ShyY1
LAIFPVLVSLGCWQLERAQTKTAWIQTLKAGETLSLTQALEHPALAQFHRITLQGEFLNEPTLLLMHQSHDRSPGFAVVNLFKIAGQEHPILVNRGFIPKTNLANLPPPPGQPLSLQGIIDLPKPDRFILGKNILDPSLRPLPLQRLDVTELEPVLHTPLLPLVILADQDLGDGLVREWQITPRMPPEKHLGYAIQWFALALCLAMIYLFVNLKKRSV